MLKTDNVYTNTNIPVETEESEKKTKKKQSTDLSKLEKEIVRIEEELSVPEMQVRQKLHYEVRIEQGNKTIIEQKIAELLKQGFDTISFSVTPTGNYAVLMQKIISPVLDEGFLSER